MLLKNSQPERSYPAKVVLPGLCTQPIGNQLLLITAYRTANNSLLHGYDEKNHHP